MSLAKIFFIIIFIILIYKFNDIPWDTSKNSKERCGFRYKSFYEKNYYKKYLLSKQESGFKIVKILNKKNSENIVVFSLYGKNPRYYKFIDYQISLKNKFNGKWTIRLYCGTDVPEKFIKILLKKDVEIYMVDDPICKPGKSSGMFWRYLPLIENVNCIILDMDSEHKFNTFANLVNNVNYFMKSKYLFYRYRSTPWPENHIMGGLIFKKKELKINMKEKFITHFPVRSNFGADELFLSYFIYPKVKNYTKTNTCFLNYYLIPKNIVFCMFKKYISIMIN